MSRKSGRVLTGLWADSKADSHTNAIKQPEGNDLRAVRKSREQSSGLGRDADVHYKILRSFNIKTYKYVRSVDADQVDFASRQLASVRRTTSPDYS